MSLYSITKAIKCFNMVINRQLITFRHRPQFKHIKSLNYRDLSSLPSLPFTATIVNNDERKRAPAMKI